MSNSSKNEQIASPSSSSNIELPLPIFDNESSTFMDLSSLTLDELINRLKRSNHDEMTLEQLRKATSCNHPTCNQNACRELAEQLWESFESVKSLLMELTTVYWMLEPSQLSMQESTRFCSILALFQCMASHPGLREAFLRAKIPCYVYPLLETAGEDKPLSYIKLAALGVIGALVKCDPKSQEAQISVHFLLETEVFPSCLRCMEKGDVLAQEVATLIVWKILLQEEGLRYCCVRAERFFSVVQVLNGIVDNLATQPQPVVRLLKRVVCCFLRLSEAPRSIGFYAESIKPMIPAKLRDDTFLEIFIENPEITRMLQQLLCNVNPGLGPNH